MEKKFQLISQSTERCMILFSFFFFTLKIKHFWNYRMIFRLIFAMTRIFHYYFFSWYFKVQFFLIFWHLRSVHDMYTRVRTQNVYVIIKLINFSRSKCVHIHTHTYTHIGGSVSMRLTRIHVKRTCIRSRNYLFAHNNATELSRE